MDGYFETVDSFPARSDDHFIPEASRLSLAELDAVQQAIGDGEFEPSRFPKLHLVQPGQRCFKNITVPEVGERKMLKVLYLNEDTMNSILGNNNASTMMSCLQNIILGNQDIPGFKHFAPHMSSNRDGHGTTFTTGLASVAHWNPAPSAHCYGEKAERTGVAKYLQRLNKEAGRLAGLLMPKVMGQRFLDFSHRRQAALNTPFFGPDYDSQAFFSSTQVNYNEVRKGHVRGVAGHVHHDGSDCAVSYTMAVNLSQLRPTTNPGYFWFPGMDLVIPLQPRQALIFQGIEQHTGTPVIPIEDDNSPLPNGDTMETRINLIMYPNHSILNERHNWRRTGTELYASVQRPNLLQDALPCFGGERNYALWIRMEALRSMMKSLKDFHHLSLNPVGFLEHIFHDTEGIAIDSTRIQSILTTVGVFESDAQSAALQDLIRSLSMLIKKHVSRPIDVSNAPVALARKRTQQMAQIFDLPHRSFSPITGHMEETEEAPGQMEQAPAPFNFQEFLNADLDMDIINPNLFADVFPSEPIAPLSPIQPFFNPPSPMSVIPGDGASSQMDILATIPNEPQSNSDEARNNQLRAWFQQGIVLEDLELELQHLQSGNRTIHDPVKALSHSLSYCQQWRTLEPANVLSNAIAHGRVLTGVLSLQESVDDWGRILDAMFLLTALNYLDGIEKRFELMDPWRNAFNPEDDATTFIPILQQRIDDCVKEWITKPPAEREEFIISSSDLFVNFANDQHVLPAEVYLKAPRAFERNILENNASLRHMMFGITLYGLLIHHPLQRWISRFGKRNVRLHDRIEKLVFAEHVPLRCNTTYRRHSIQLRLYQALLQNLGQGMSPSERILLHVLRQPYDMVFGNQIPSHDLRDWMPETLLELMERNEAVLNLPLIRSSVRDLAKAWDHRLGFNKILTANHAIRTLPSLNRQPNVVRARAKTTIPSRPSAAASSSKVRFNPGRILSLLPAARTVPAECESGWPRILFDYLGHAFRAAHLLVKLARKHQGNMIDFVGDKQYTAIQSNQTRAFLRRAVMSSLEGDKLVGLRTCGPSMSCFRARWPLERILENQRHFLHHLLVARVWAWGKLDAIKGLQTLPPGPEPILELFQRLGREHGARSKSNPHLFSYFGMVQAYGQSARSAEALPDWLKESWELAGRLTAKFTTNPQAPPFAKFKDILVQEANARAIPYISTASLMTWLICCDLSEWDMIQPPTADDLADRLINGGGRGPSLAFEQMAVERQVEKIQWMRQPIQRLLAIVTPALAKVYDEPCRRIQGRGFNHADVEHLLCKVTREWKAVVPKKARDQDGFPLPGEQLEDPSEDSPETSSEEEESVEEESSSDDGSSSES